VCLSYFPSFCPTYHTHTFFLSSFFVMLPHTLFFSLFSIMLPHTPLFFLYALPTLLHIHTLPLSLFCFACPTTYSHNLPLSFLLPFFSFSILLPHTTCSLSTSFYPAYLQTCTHFPSLLLSIPFPFFHVATHTPIFPFSQTQNWWIYFVFKPYLECVKKLLLEKE
jgi:hypothetical protein